MKLFLFAAALGSSLLVSQSRAAPSWDAPPTEQAGGQFWRFHWFERGLTNGNPAYQDASG